MLAMPSMSQIHDSKMDCGKSRDASPVRHLSGNLFYKTSKSEVNFDVGFVVAVFVSLMKWRNCRDWE